MCLPNTPGHGRKQLWPDTWPRPWTLGNTDPARRRFREEWDALVEVHIPALNAADHLFLLDDGTGRTRVGADLASGTEFICAEAVGRSGDERHIRGDARQTHPRSKLSADQGSVLAEFTEARCNGRGNKNQGVRRGAGIGCGAVSLRANPIRERIRRAGAPR